MLDASPEPISDECATHDADGFLGVLIKEWINLETAHNLALFIEEQGRLGAAMLDPCCNDLEEAKWLIDNGCFSGVWDSVADYPEDMIEQTMEIPNPLAICIDYASMARDKKLNGDIFTIRIDSEVHIFLKA